ncbi:MAG: hypothetical protein IEMM0008_0956 [bacterium]|nr:MAG: hypothetical protein IEMM0008_0956 [bacterium]
MWDDLEMISLKILKLLYHQYHDLKASELSEQAIAKKMNCTYDEEITELQKALSELKKVALVRNARSGYVISEKGLKHYEQFKFLKGDEENLNYPSSITINGNVNSINNRPSYHQHNYHVYGEGVTFPGGLEETNPLYKNLLEILNEIESLGMDAPQGEKMIEKLEDVRSIIQLMTQESGLPLKVEEKVGDLIHEIKNKLDME